MSQLILENSPIKWLMLICLFVANVMIGSVMALENAKEPCRAFVLSGMEKDYRKCNDLMKKADEGHSHDGNSSFNLNWLRNPKLQSRFTRHVASGELLYVKLAFEILPLLDGELAEISLMSLGHSITSSPHIFLNELQQHYGDVTRRDALDGLVGNLGPEYVDRFEMQVKILKKRRAAIKSVKDPHVRNIKKIVNGELNQQIEELERLLKADTK